MPSTFPKAINDFSTTTTGHAAGATTLVLASGAGAALGSLPANRIFRVTALTNPETASETILGVFEATGISTDTLTGVTGAEGFGNVALTAGVTIEIRMTAKDYEDHSTAINTAETSIATLGTIATQSAASVAITGGSIDSVTIGATTPIQAQAYRPINAQTGTTYTLVIGDDGKLVTLSNAGAITLTVPPNSSVAFPVGAEIDLAQLGAGQVTVAPGSGVTINSYQGKTNTAGQYAGATVKQTAANSWLLIGNLA